LRTGYAIELTFDQRTEERVVALWNAVAAAGISSYMPEVSAFPHISLSVYDLLDCDKLRSSLAKFAARTPPLDLRLSTVGTFPGSEGVVFIGPVVTPKLLNLHHELDALIAGLGFEAWDYYRPTQWIPHCTVGIHLEPDLVCECIQLCRGADVFGEASIVGISVVSFPPVREICAFPLLGEEHESS
jgi:2'-5' RNA ligase